MSGHTPDLKAYYVTDGDEQSELLFVKRRRDAERWADGEWGGYDELRRAPEFDRYSPGPVPPLALVKNGWWLECHGCERRIDSDLRVEELADLWLIGPVWCEIDLDPVADGRRIWCTPGCRAHQEEDLRQQARAKYLCAAWATASLRQKHPELDLLAPVHVHVTRDESGAYTAAQVIIPFTFPGAKIGTGNYRFERRGEKVDSAFWICGGDMPAWRWFQFSLKGVEAFGDAGRSEAQP